MPENQLPRAHAGLPQAVACDDDVLLLAKQCGLLGNEWYSIRDGPFGSSKRLTEEARAVLTFADKLLDLYR